MPEDDENAPEGLQARATDYLSAAVEQRAKARAAIAAGDSPKDVVTSLKPTGFARKGPIAPMETGDDDSGPRLRAIKPPVQPVPKAELMPPVRISAEQEAILSRLSPSSTPPVTAAPARPVRSPAPAAAEPEAAPPARRTRAVEMPEPGERSTGRREYRAPEWDRYYNPGMFANAKIPRLPIERQGPAGGAPAWELVGRPKGEGHVVDARSPYRASLKEGAVVKNSKPEREVERFLAERGPSPGEELDLAGPSEVPPAPSEDEEREAARRAEFEAAMADLERSFREGEVVAPRPPQAPTPRSAPPPAPSRGDVAVQAAAERALPSTRTTAPAAPPQRAIARSRADERSEEDENEIAAEDEEEAPIGRQPPPDRLAEQAAHRPLAHDATGAALCPTCGRRITPHNAVLVCTSCGRVSCGTCGKFSAGQPAGNIYQYEYKFKFPLCEPCFERHLGIQKNLARAKAYLASGNMTYAYYHAQTALQTDAGSPYAADANALLKQVEARRNHMQKADKEWEEARKKMMRQRTTVLK